MIVTIQNNKIKASIKSFGAELLSLQKDDYNYIWKIDEAYWNKTSPVLFPIVGSLKNDEYVINNEKFSLSRHGFARDYNFEIINQEDNKVVFCLKSNPETYKKYPFDFELKIGYELYESTIIVTYTVTNNSMKDMPFNIGAHPAFSMPDNIWDYSIIFNDDTLLNTYELANNFFSGNTKTLVLDNNYLPLSYSLFEKDALVFKNLKSRKIDLQKNNKPYISIHLNNFPHLGIWTKPNAPFLCIEPWHGYADNYNSDGDIFSKDGIQIVKEKQSFNTSFVIEII